MQKHRPGGPTREGVPASSVYRLNSDRTVDRLTATKQTHTDLVTLGQSTETADLARAARSLHNRSRPEQWVLRYQANVLSGAIGAFAAGPVSMAVQEVVQGEFMAGPLFLVDESKDRPAIRDTAPVGWGCIDLKANQAVGLPNEPHTKEISNPGSARGGSKSSKSARKNR